MAITAATILRVLVDSGHGLSNNKAGVWDPGAVSGCGEEASLIREVASGVEQSCHLATPSILPFPECGPDCIQKHERDGTWLSSHLDYKVKWANKTYKKFDFIISLHCNSADNPTASGVEVYYSDGAPLIRKRQAQAAAKALAETLGIPNRGIRPSWKSQHPRLAILDDTKGPALLFELGFITNPVDVEAIQERGVQAVLMAIKAITEAR